MKPLGMRLTLQDGIGLRVVHPTHAEDKVWEAVEAAIEAGWTPERFKREAASAWSDYRSRGQADDEGKEMLR